MCQKNEEFINLLEKEELTYREGNDLCRLLHDALNNGLYETYASLSSRAKERMQFIGCMVGHRFACDRAWHGKETWDLRIKASENFAMLHDGEFFEFLRKRGFVSDQGCDDYSSHFFKFTPEECRAYQSSWAFGFMCYWSDFHSTLKQGFFKVICKILVEEGVLDCRAPYFPMY